MSIQPNKRIYDSNEFKQSQNFQPNKNNSSTIALSKTLKTHQDQNKFPTIKNNKPNSQQTKRATHGSISLQAKTSLPNNSNNSPKKVWPLGFGKKRLLYLIQEEQSKKEMERKKEDQQKQKQKQKEKEKQKQNPTNANNQQLPNSTKKENYSRQNNQLPTTTTHNIQVQKQTHQNYQLVSHQQQKQPPVQTQINKLFNKKKPYLTNSSNQNLKNPQIFSGIQDNTTKLVYSKNLLTKIPNPIVLNNLAKTQQQQISDNGNLTNNNLHLSKNVNTQVFDSRTILNAKTRRTTSPNKQLATIQLDKNPKISKTATNTKTTTTTTKTTTPPSTPTPTPTTKTNSKIESKHNYGNNLTKIDLHSVKNIQSNASNLNKEKQLNDNFFPIKQNPFLIKNQNNNLNNTDSKRTNGTKVKMTNENSQHSIQTEINNHKQQKNNTNPNFNNLREKKFAFEKNESVEMDMVMDTSMDMGKNVNNNINIAKKNNKYQIILPNKKTNGQELTLEKSKENYIRNQDNNKGNKDNNKRNQNNFDDNEENNDGDDKNNNFNIILNNSNEFWNLEKDLNERTKKNKSFERYSNNNKISQTFNNKNEDYIDNKIENTKPKKTSKSFEQRKSNNNKNSNKVSLKNLQETSKNENVNENEIEILNQNENGKNELIMRKNEYNHRAEQGEESQTQKKIESEKNDKKSNQRKPTNMKSQSPILTKKSPIVFKKNKMIPNPHSEFKYYKYNSIKESGMGRESPLERERERERGMEIKPERDRERGREREYGRERMYGREREYEREREKNRDRNYYYKEEYGRGGEYQRERERERGREREREREYLYKREYERERSREKNLNNDIPTEREKYLYREKYLPKEKYFPRSLERERYFDAEKEVLNDRYYDYDYDKILYSQSRTKKSYPLEKNHYYDRNRYYNEKRINDGYSFNNNSSNNSNNNNTNNANKREMDIYRNKVPDRYKYNERASELPPRRFQDKSWERNTSRIKIRDPFLDKEYGRGNHPLREYEREEEEWDKEKEIEKIRQAMRERVKKREGKKGIITKTKTKAKTEPETQAKTEMKMEMKTETGETEIETKKTTGRGMQKQQPHRNRYSESIQKGSHQENETNLSNIDSMIYVWPLESELIQKEEIKKKFSNYGEIVKIIQEKTHAIIQFKTPQHAQNAINSSKKLIINDRNVIVRPFEMWRIKNLNLQNTLTKTENKKQNHHQPLQQRRQQQKQQQKQQQRQQQRQQKQKLEKKQKKEIEISFSRKRAFQIDNNQLDSKRKSLLLKLSQLQNEMLNEQNNNIKSSVSIIIRHHENFSQGLSIKSKIKKDLDLAASLTILPKHRFMDDLVQEAKNNGTNYIVLIEKNDSNKELQSFTLKINDFIKKMTKTEDNLSLDLIIERIKYFEKELKSIKSLNQIQFFNPETTQKLLQKTLRDRLSKNSMSSLGTILNQNSKNSKSLEIGKDDQKQN
ncbi:chascon isoform d-related [Anaeramoeba flamelloides]|uniref:Chascon isoform d-related n=1 Tax=Anaeramoeba flamelloides TaxID=1746091 RepID=A0AAV7ZRV8_9EUKA|nr:chascon isoform d-related [Anaeramoeba flamelloides]